MSDPQRTECYVSDEDYARHWQGKGAKRVTAPAWSGEERRINAKDRRTTGHERRWESSRGRRFRLGDRRKGV